MYIVHPTDTSLCDHLTLPGDVVTEASQGLLSAYGMCRGQGFTLALDDGNSDVEGFYKFTTPLTFCDGRLESGTVSKFIPVVFDPLPTSPLVLVLCHRSITCRGKVGWITILK